MNNVNSKSLLNEAFHKSLNVGLAGYSAMIVQVASMMWLRTTMNYQFKNGGTTLNTIKLLYNQGGIPRFYKGVSFALINAPLSRFGDTAANMSVMTYFKDSDLNTIQKTAIGSSLAGLWRLSIIPIDSFKSHLQVHGKDGTKILKNKIKKEGINTLYRGSLASLSATVIGHFPWFLTYNHLQEKIPKVNDHDYLNYLRSGTIGFMSSGCSDIISNSIRVLKTNKQTTTTNDGYKNIISNIVEKESILGLFTRGLKTKLIINGMQGFIFVIIFDKIKDILS